MPKEYRGELTGAGRRVVNGTFQNHTPVSRRDFTLVDNLGHGLFNHGCLLLDSSVDGI